jgi:opacity protein-like surface antigen
LTKECLASTLAKNFFWKEKTMKKLAVFLLIYSLTLFSSSALAQGSSSDKLSYLGLTAGIVSPQYLRGELSSVDDTSDHISLSDLDLSRGYMLGMRVGRVSAPPKAFAAIELEGLMITGTDAEPDFYYYEASATSNVTADADISVKAMILNIFLRHPFGSIHPYVGFGLGWAWFDADMVLTLQPGFIWPGTGTGTGNLDVSDNDYAIQVLVGMEWDMTDVLSLDLGYRYFRTKADATGAIGNTNFDIDMTYKTQMITAGLKYRF